MITREHIDQAMSRLKEINDQLAIAEIPVDSDEWWEAFSEELEIPAAELSVFGIEVAPKDLERWPATRGLLVGLLAARYAEAEVGA